VLARPVPWVQGPGVVGAQHPLPVRQGRLGPAADTAPIGTSLSVWPAGRWPAGSPVREGRGVGTMSGAAMIRGSSFQAVVTLAAVIGMVNDPAAALIRVEGKEDVVDFEVIGVAGERLRTCQAKTKAEPRTWSASGLLPVLQSWAALPESHETDFEFITDGQLGESGVQLSVVIERVKAGADDAEIAELAARMGRVGGILPSAELLRRVTLTTLCRPNTRLSG
jgi:hypothetical protein